MLKLISDKRLIYVAPVVTATEAVLFSFSYLWIGPWLRDVAILDERSVGLTLTRLFSSTGIAAGYFLNGALGRFICTHELAHVGKAVSLLGGRLFYSLWCAYFPRK